MSVLPFVLLTATAACGVVIVRRLVPEWDGRRSAPVIRIAGVALIMIVVTLNQFR